MVNSLTFIRIDPYGATTLRSVPPSAGRTAFAFSFPYGAHEKRTQISVSFFVVTRTGLEPFKN